jgi:2-C-methyl-D-erythritol 2,4-cyclodiphosphate synthase
MIKTGLGQDSHRIQQPSQGKALILGGVRFDEAFSLEGNSDSDVILHAITNAISGVTGRPVLGPVADDLCKAGISDSSAYLRLAMADLIAIQYRLSHVSISLECQRPKILPKLAELRTHLAVLLGLTVADIGITATSGEGLTDFGRGLGIQALAVVTTQKIA